MDDARTESAVVVDWTPERLHEHFAGQLIEQGWTEDSSSAGSLSAGSAWLREEGDEALLGALQLLSSGEGQYRASFRVTVLPEPGD